MSLAAVTAAGLLGLTVLWWRPGGGPELARVASAPGPCRPWRGTPWRGPMPHGRPGTAADGEAIAGVAAAVAAELAAGLPPAEAMRRAVDGLPAAQLDLDWVAALREAPSSDHVLTVLRRHGDGGGRAGLSDMAMCWSLAADTGAGLAGGLQAVASAERARTEHRLRVHAAMAGLRATGWLLAVLPLVGLLLGSVAGASPLGTLLGTSLGRGLLMLGLGLELAGVLWMRWLARRAMAVL